MAGAGWGIEPWGVDSGDGEGPTIENLSPAPGQLPSANQAIQFDVLDVTPDLQVVYIWIAFDNQGDVLLMYDGATFQGTFAGGSSAVAITNGLRFTVFRSGGWPSAFYLTVKAHDDAGNQAA